MKRNRGRTHQSDIVKAAARHVRTLFRERLPRWVVYHDLSHTRDVVRMCLTIAGSYRLSAGEREVLLLAAWFHDAGYTVTAKGHEEASVSIAQKFLSGAGYSAQHVSRILRCIMATKVPQRPRSPLERILCDADLSSLGRANFISQNDRLKLEIERREGIRHVEEAWLRRSWLFLHRHRSHTRYAREHFDPVRRRNLDRLTKALARPPKTRRTD